MFKNQELLRQYNRINKLITEVKKFEPDDELQSHLTKYICILCSGFIENAIYYTLSDIVDNVAEKSIVTTYAKSQLYKIQNPNSEKIRVLIKSFNQEWHDPLKNFLQKNGRSSAINSILKERHNIAHGRNSDITIRILEENFNKINDVIQYIENLT